MLTVRSPLTVFALMHATRHETTMHTCTGRQGTGGSQPWLSTANCQSSLVLHINESDTPL